MKRIRWLRIKEEVNFKCMKGHFQSFLECKTIFVIDYIAKKESITDDTIFQVSSELTVKTFVLCGLDYKSQKCFNRGKYLAINMLHHLEN